MAHYSSLFTWGLLSERATPSPPPTSTSPKLFSKFRKTSLPSASLCESASSMYTLDPADDNDNDDAEDLPPPEWNSAFFFSVRDGRGSAELRSFLSLDLAESQSMRSAKHRRAESRDVQPVAFTMPAPMSAPLIQPAEPLSPTHRASPLPPSSPSSSSSRRVDQYRSPPALSPTRRVSPLPPSSPAGPSSHRTLSPLPPSPSALLPPHPRTASPRSPARSFSPLPPSPVAPSTRRPSRDSLRHLPSPKPAPNTTLPQIPTSPRRALPPLPHLNTTVPAPSVPSPSSSSSPWTSHRSTLSAPSVLPPPSPTPSSCLIPSPIAVPQTQTQRFSFASGATSVRTPSKRSANRSDALACLEGRDRARYRRRNFMSLSDDEDEDEEDDEADVEDELDDDVQPAVKPSPVRAKPRTRSRRGTADSWFPFANFIDLRDDDLPSWRSFIEIASTA
ncbi:hypothetical protein DENSPDRAFT_853060 [Dentipellis sp. KUC8613]|nr:hypothetical protein DENSPDRAFT_853060 [Dentipellis sp. KUC8613]